MKKILILISLMFSFSNLYALELKVGHKYVPRKWPEVKYIIVIRDLTEDYNKYETPTNTGPMSVVVVAKNGDRFAERYYKNGSIFKKDITDLDLIEEYKEPKECKCEDKTITLNGKKYKEIDSDNCNK